MGNFTTPPTSLLGQSSVSTTSQTALSYNSFSGSDIRATIGTLTFAQIQAISYSVTREKAPIYTMGSPDPRSFSRNKRGVAGSLIWVNFDRHALLSLMWASNGQFVANQDDLRPAFQNATSQFIADGALSFTEPTTVIPGVVSPIPATATVDQSSIPQVAAIAGQYGFKTTAKPWYSDQILPFDITLLGATEYGAATGMKIFGVEILNEGSGISIDDSVTEMQATFVARLVEPWIAVATPFRGTIANQVVGL